MKKMMSLLLCSGSMMLAVPAMARYLCKSYDGSTIVRVFPYRGMAEVIRLDGRPPYIMSCQGGNGETVSCEGEGGRTFVMYPNLRAQYFGSVRTTELSCSYAGRGGYGGGGYGY